MIPFGLEALMTLSLPIARRATKCFVPGASAIYLCNEGAGTAVYDRSGNQYDGTITAGATAPTWATEGLTFDGGDYVTLPDVGAALSGGATFQVVARPGADVTTEQWLVSAGVTKAGGLAVMNGKHILLAPAAQTGQYLYSVSAALANTWVDVAGTITWSGAIAVYLNGVQNAVGTTTNGWTTPGASTQAIGARTTTGAAPLTGAIAAVLVYPFALSPAQIAQNHAALKSLVAPRGITLP